MTNREEFLFDCVMLGDLTPFNGILTEADAIFVSAALRVKHKYESEHHYVMLDVRFYLARLSAIFTGTEGGNFLPTSVHAMEERLSGGD